MGFITIKVSSGVTATDDDVARRHRQCNDAVLSYAPLLRCKADADGDVAILCVPPPPVASDFIDLAVVCIPEGD